jgi:general stress protein 26
MFSKRSHHNIQASDSVKNRQIYDFLSSHPVGVLAMVTPSNDPHAVAMYYSVEQNFDINFITKVGTKKHDNFEHNAHVVLLVYESESQTTVQVTGSVNKITDETVAQQAFSNTVRSSINTSGSGVPPISKLSAGEYAAYQLIPSQITMAIFEKPKHGNYDSLYETITF